MGLTLGLRRCRPRRPFPSRCPRQPRLTHGNVAQRRPRSAQVKVQVTAGTHEVEPRRRQQAWVASHCRKNDSKIVRIRTQKPAHSAGARPHTHTISECKTKHLPPSCSLHIKQFNLTPAFLCPRLLFAQALTRLFITLSRTSKIDRTGGARRSGAVHGLRLHQYIMFFRVYTNDIYKQHNHFNLLFCIGVRLSHIILFQIISVEIKIILNIIVNDKTSQTPLELDKHKSSSTLNSPYSQAYSLSTLNTPYLSTIFLRIFCSSE